MLKIYSSHFLPGVLYHCSKMIKTQGKSNNFDNDQVISAERVFSLLLEEFEKTKIESQNKDVHGVLGLH